MSKSIITVIVSLLAMFILIACKPSQTATESKIKEHVFSTQEKALRKAQALQGVLDKSHEKRMKQLDKLEN